MTRLFHIVASPRNGSSDFRIIVHHLLPNSLSPLIVQATVSISYAILAESTLSFLGLGVEITRSIMPALIERRTCTSG